MLNQKLLGTTSKLPSDDNFENVSLLLSGDGTNGAQNNTFLDSSTNNFTITRNGNTTQSSFSPYAGLTSVYSNNTIAGSSYLSLGNPTVLNPSTNNFTVEMFVNVTEFGSVGYAPLITKYNGGGLNDWYLFMNGNGSIDFGCQNSVSPYTTYTASSPAGTCVLGTWYHIAGVRNGTTLTLYVNGVSVATATLPSGMTVRNSATIAISKMDGYGTNTNCGAYFSNVRFVNGTAVYTSNFTPSTSALTAITNTALLTCQSSTIVDNSGNSLSVTASGTVSIQVSVFRLFNPIQPYNTATIGGSGYFDGSGDYLALPSSSNLAFGTGDFTIECWFYQTNNTGGQDIIGNASSAGTNNWGIYLTSSLISFLNYNAGIVNTSSPSLNSWHHIAISRSGTTLSMFIDGVRGATTTYSTDISSTNSVRIGYFGNAYFNGYISNVRVVKGTAVYNPSSTTITIPTSPVTAITNTQLLTNFTNAGIPDLAMQNSLETVGSAQVSTSVKKYGTGSIYITTTGDELKSANKPQFAFGTGNFTIEFWLYTSSTSYGLLDIDGGTSAGWWRLFVLSSTMYWQSARNTTNILSTSSTTVQNNAWHHIAVARYNGTTYLYFDGVSQTSGADTTNYNQSTGNLNIGYTNAGTGYQLVGYMDDVRITSGYCRYPSGTTFTPPTAALPTY
jgi:hypothetical protein